MSSSTKEPSALTPEQEQLHKFYPGCLSLPRAASAPSPKDCPSDFMTFSNPTSSRTISRDYSLTNVQETDPFVLDHLAASGNVFSPAGYPSQPGSQFHVPNPSRQAASSYRIHNFTLLTKVVEIELQSTNQTLSQLSRILDDTMATLSRSLASARTSHAKRTARAVRLGMIVEEESSRVQELQAQIDMYTRGWEVTLRDGENKIEELETKLWEMTIIGRG